MLVVCRGMVTGNTHLLSPASACITAANSSPGTRSKNHSGGRGDPASYADEQWANDMRQLQINNKGVPVSMNSSDKGQLEMGNDDS